MRTIVKRLTEGQDLMVEVNRLADEYNVRAGVILSAVGSLSNSKIRVPIIDGNVKYIHPKNLEIDALHGTVSLNGCHLHATVSDVNGIAMGGHLKEGCIIRTTFELVIGVLDDVTFKREPDIETGFDELVVNSQPLQ